MKLIFRVLVFFLSLFFTSELVIAQDDWNAIIEKTNGLVIQQNQHVDISINDSGNLEIISKIYEETQHFDDNAKLFSEQSIGYSNTFSEILDLEAFSLIPKERNKFKKIPVKDFVVSDAQSSGIFYDDQKRINFVYPALKANSKTTISYSKKYKEPRLWGYYMFSSYYPVQKSVYSVKAPQEVKLKFSKYSIDEEEVRFTIVKKGKYIIYTWTAEHLNKIQLSKGTDGVLHTAPHLIIHVDSYTYNGITHNVLGDVKDLHAWYQNFLEGIDDEENDDMKIMVGNIIENKATEVEKVEAIYNWVQQNVKYIAIEDGLGGFRPRSSNTVFSRRYGDCKDMSNLIYNMLDLADINSSLTWIGTTSIPYSHVEVPTPMADNHMICTYVNNNKYYFLDATDQYNIMGIPTSHIQGQEALINKSVNDFELVNVPVVPYNENIKSDSVFISIMDNRVLGSGRVSYSGYKKIPVANSLLNLNESDKKTLLTMLLKKGNNKFSLDSVTTQNVSDKNSNLLIDYNFSVDDYLVSTQDEIFINPHFRKELEDGFIDIATSKKDIHYSYKSLTSNIYNIAIPDGFDVSFLPEDSQYKGDDFGFSLDYKVKDNIIFIDQKVKINTLQLGTDQFESWNKMIKKLFSAYKESIVLERDITNKE